MLKLIRKRIAVLMTFLLCFTMADMSALMTAYAEEIEETKETAVESEAEESVQELAETSTEEEDTKLEAEEETLLETVTSKEAEPETEEEKATATIQTYEESYLNIVEGETEISFADTSTVCYYFTPEVTGYYEICFTGNNILNVSIFGQYKNGDGDYFWSSIFSKYGAFINGRLRMKEGIIYRIEIKARTIQEDCSIIIDYQEPLEWTLEDGVLTVSGKGDMDNCSSWSDYKQEIREVIIEYGVTSIDAFAFYGCENLTDISIPESVTRIEEDAFLNCRSLNSIRIPNGVIEIGGDVFKSCDKLTEVFIPESVESIGSGNFVYCYCLQAINVDPANNYYSSLDGVLFDKNKETMYKCPAQKKGALIIPDTTIYTDYNAFEGCNYLTSINIPASLLEIKTPYVIDYYALDIPIIEGSSLEEINVDPNNTVYSSENGILFNKEKTCMLRYPPNKEEKSYTIPDTVQRIDSAAFRDCKKIVQVFIPSGVTVIEKGLFWDCISLERVVLGKQTIFIRNSAFSGTSLKSISIPETITYIDPHAFAYSGLSEIYFSGNAPAFPELCLEDESEWYPNDAFQGDTLTAFYPADNPTWTEDVLQPYGAESIEWIPWNPETEEIQGYIDVIEDSENAETKIGVHVIGSGDDLVLECNLPLQYFVSVEIDGVTVDPSNYELKSGSTIITFDGSFLDTLTPGTHTVTMNYNINGRKVAVKTSIVIREKSGSTDKPSKPNTPDSSKPSKPSNSDSSKPSNGSTETNNETAAASQNKVTMKAHLVDANGQPMYNCTLEIHSDPVSATLGTDGTASFKNIEVGDHTMYLKDQNGKMLASKAIRIVHDKAYSITGGDTIHVVKGRAFVLNVKYDGENLILLSVEGDQTPATGDTSTVHIWLLLMALSAAGMVLVLARKRKQIKK